MAAKMAMAARVPISRCSTRRCSFGPWMPSSGSAKPESTVGTPRPTSVATIGMLPPLRTGTHGQPVEAPMAAAPARRTGSRGSHSAGRAPARSENDEGPAVEHQHNVRADLKSQLAIQVWPTPQHKNRQPPGREARKQRFVTSKMEHDFCPWSATVGIRELHI